VIAVEEYRDTNGRSRFSEWYVTLDTTVAAKISLALDRVGLGHTSALKAVGEGVLEYRIDAGPGYRIYLAKDGDKLVILFGGGTKKRQQQDITLAKKNWREYKEQKKRGTLHLVKPVKGS